MMYESADWKAFLNADSISRMAGAGYQQLIPLIFKELGDNALDTSGSCRHGWIREKGFEQCCPIGGFVEDDGPGIPGKSPEEIADFFLYHGHYAARKRSDFRPGEHSAMGSGWYLVQSMSSAVTWW